jgi:hypothetical protein
MSGEINHNKAEPKPNPKNQNILKENKVVNGFPKIHNFFFTKNYENFFGPKYNFIEKKLLKLNYLPRNIILASVISNKQNSFLTKNRFVCRCF